jgi:hypothetical protein
LSIVARQEQGLAVIARTGVVLLGLAGCGWHLGPPAEALAVGPVRGAPLEPGLQAALREEVVRALRRAGVGEGGSSLVLEVRSEAEVALAAVPGEAGGAGARASSLVLRASVPARPGCEVEVKGARSWVLAGDAPAAAAARDDAVRDLAGDLADRLVDAILGNEACRTRS